MNEKAYKRIGDLFTKHSDQKQRDGEALRQRQAIAKLFFEKLVTHIGWPKPQAHLKPDDRGGTFTLHYAEHFAVVGKIDVDQYLRIALSVGDKETSRRVKHDASDTAFLEECANLLVDGAQKFFP